MMIYRYKVDWFDEYDNVERHSTGFIAGKEGDYGGVVARLTDLYGAERISSVSVRWCDEAIEDDEVMLEIEEDGVKEEE